VNLVHLQNVNKLKHPKKTIYSYSLCLDLSIDTHIDTLLPFLSAATLVVADYGFTCPPRFMSVVVECCVLLCDGTDKKCNFSAVDSPIELKLGGDLWLVSQISVHVLVLRFDYFLYCKQTKEPKNAKIAKIVILQNLCFLSRAEFD
jgi:hypothetical protein